MSGPTSVFWGCLPITRRCESWVRVMLESTNHASIVFICGGNAETDLLASVVGQFVDKFEPRPLPRGSTKIAHQDIVPRCSAAPRDGTSRAVAGFGPYLTQGCWTRPVGCCQRFAFRGQPVADAVPNYYVLLLIGVATSRRIGRCAAITSASCRKVAAQ
jgi:hypothetical protein